jgi:hypothetical protein
VNRVFYHTYAPKKESLDIVIDLLNRSTKLLDCVDEFNIILTGKLSEELMRRKEIKDVTENSDKFIFFLDRSNSGERSTLHLLHRTVGKDDKVFYFHSKGSTKADTDWIDLINGWSYKLIYFLVDQREKCVNFLDDYDVVGANYWGEFTPDSCRESCDQATNPPAHFSGNFWWARGDHIKRLNVPIGLDYNDPEFWVTSIRPIKIAAMSNILINPYINNYTFESYKDEQPKFSVLES